LENRVRCLPGRLDDERFLRVLRARFRLRDDGRHRDHLGDVNSGRRGHFQVTTAAAAAEHHL
jgi:hypothetical protein